MGELVHATPLHRTTVANGCFGISIARMSVSSPDFLGLEHPTQQHLISSLFGDCWVGVALQVWQLRLTMAIVSQGFLVA